MEKTKTCSVDLFTGAIRLLAKRHGNKICDSTIEDLRQKLAEAEAIYRAMPDVTDAEGAPHAN